MKQLLIATGNRHKLDEFRMLLAGLPVELVGLHDVGVTDEIAETGTTFEANARLKADGYCRLSGFPTLADDSGLVVDALGGAPGVYSARYGGVQGAAQLALVLDQLHNVPRTERTARFECVLALALPAQPTQVVRGTVEGVIGWEARGDHGFGYDPLFVLPERNQTMAEISAAEKNTISHRGRAVAAMEPLLRAVFTA
jgi:XTP/dITP diphosphohydrolase